LTCKVEYNSPALCNLINYKEISISFDGRTKTTHTTAVLVFVIKENRKGTYRWPTLPAFPCNIKIVGQVLPTGSACRISSI